MSDTFRTIAAAEALLTSSNDGKWKMADAVLADVPGWLDGEPAHSRLVELAEALTAAGIATPNGEFYMVQSLSTMRRTALAWPPEQRHPDVAYRTHQEADRDGDLGREVLAALACVARGEPAEYPEGSSPSAFEAAKERVERRVSAKRVPRFKVAANDMRVAMNHAINTPVPKRDRGQVVYLLSEVSSASQSLRTFAQRFVEAEPSPEDRKSIAQALEQLIVRAEETLGVVTTSVMDLSAADLDMLKEDVDD